ncbi:isoprenyl transferase [Maritimibacter sp. 55A14]|uniref:isoprenyl transferase n=1 Tax=Maritimibacter sp. 55A14 TaxID=2174844 RepID=UPI000D61C5BA|nr:isoprenyl transferase [Maritimibacter sp. 55A14]PWE33647.1 isoprenyl transferase [Maritimibacter sp. 55A14]
MSEHIEYMKIPNCPEHVAIVMDGNGRWAAERGLPRTHGHHRGVERVREIVRAAPSLGVKILTIYAFSTENWHRPDHEVRVLMSLFRRFVVREVDDLETTGVRVRFIGQRERLPGNLRNLMAMMEARTAQCRDLTLQIALNYGARSELVDAVRVLAERVRAGDLDPDAITEAELGANLYTQGLPDPDLIIRTSGEKRLSNFLLWQSAYSEFAFIPECWPDFTAGLFATVLREAAGRERRFGMVKAT